MNEVGQLPMGLWHGIVTPGNQARNQGFTFIRCTTLVLSLAFFFLWWNYHDFIRRVIWHAVVQISHLFILI